MSEKTPPPAPEGRPADEPTSKSQRRLGQSWSDLIEERIRAAQAEGEFDNLPGAGKPLTLDDNPYAGDRALAFHLLQVNHVLPQELELGREIEADLARADKLLDRLRRERNWIRTQPAFSQPRLRRAYLALRAKVAQEYEQALQELRSKTLTLNIIAPSALHRPLLDVEERMQAFQQEFPPA